MAKMMGPRFKQCRRLGLNVCGHPKATDNMTNNNINERMMNKWQQKLLDIAVYQVQTNAWTGN